ncbi:hypothetical protein AMECASPLE_028738 [Ameca splendens]|uniref:Uncharacterized protein n=1 Tax=Ameca splendens TaxID=208324 RepID=A0ABV0YSM4_9TELE
MNNFSNFKVQLIEIKCDSPVLFAVHHIDSAVVPAAFTDIEFPSLKYHIDGDVDQLLDDFNAVCLDVNAPLKTKCCKASMEPWLNKHYCAPAMGHKQRDW